MSATVEKAAERGRPSYSWQFGQERRLSLIAAITPLEDKTILDIGCGVGTYVKRFRKFSAKVVGVDVEFERVKRGSADSPNLMVAEGEHLPFESNCFDIILLNEVIEHVADDAQTLREAVRVAKPGGYVVVYAPNRLYPLETHGIYVGKKFIYRLTPFVNWTPNFIRNKFVPHARVYLGKDLNRLIRGLPVSVVMAHYVFPGYDKIFRRSRAVGTLLRKVTYAMERSPFRRLGISHFFVIRKDS